MIPSAPWASGIFFRTSKVPPSRLEANRRDFDLRLTLKLIPTYKSSFRCDAERYVLYRHVIINIIINR